MNRILIVEDDLTYSMMLKTWLGKKGFQVETASNVACARKQLEQQPADLILSDLRLPDHEGTELLEWMAARGLSLPLIIMTGYADIRSAVQAMKLGACDYVAKPVNPDELLRKISEALGRPQEAAPAPAIGKPASTTLNAVPTPPSDYLEGESDAARRLYNYVRLVAPTQMSVLINGASGTGKEYVAHRIHQLSRRADAPFVAIDCGTIPRELAASEFFGHVKGAFTGALADKTGAFAEANGGTLFLDEIGNLSYEVQVQLLRALQEHRIRPVGSGKEISVDVRLVAATNENLEQAIAKGTFREDLYHRINEFSLHMPALKERPEDIMLFANLFLDQANRELDKQLTGFTEPARQLLQAYHWPGNLRQMKNIVRRATLLAEGKFITPNELVELQPASPATSSATSPVIFRAASHAIASPAVAPLHDEADERRRIREVLRQTGNNKSRAAQLLGIDRKTLYNKLKQWGEEE